jgi:hypothetical protein
MYLRNTAASLGVAFRNVTTGALETGGTPAAYVMKASTAAGAFGASAAAAGTFTHRGNGQWEFAATAGDMDGARVYFTMTLSGAHPVEIEVFTTEVFTGVFTASLLAYDTAPASIVGDATPNLMQWIYAAALGGAGATEDATDGTEFDVLGFDDSTIYRTVPVDTTGATAERGRIADAVDAEVGSGIKGTVKASPSPTATAFTVEGLPANSSGLSGGYVEFLSGTLRGVAAPITSFTAGSSGEGVVALASGAIPAAPAAGVSLRILGHQGD